MTEHLIGEALLERLDALEARTAQRVVDEPADPDAVFSVRDRHEQAMREARGQA